MNKIEWSEAEKAQLKREQECEHDIDNDLIAKYGRCHCTKCGGWIH